MLKLNRMGVMNITPNSFSDAGQLPTLESFHSRFKKFAAIEAIDIGAESTAPMNSSISASEEWSRFEPFIDFLQSYPGTLSIDTYHPETIFKFVQMKKDHDLKAKLIWNDVSGKFDEHVCEYLKSGHGYVFCHNLAPTRNQTVEHMKYTSDLTGPDFLDELSHYFKSHVHSQIIFDPCLGFSKTYEQNWYILEHFQKLTEKVNHDSWLIGFSRKSFLRKKHQLDLSDLERLDHVHLLELKKILPTLPSGELWIRTHRPELLNF